MFPHSGEIRPRCGRGFGLAERRGHETTGRAARCRVKRISVENTASNKQCYAQECCANADLGRDAYLSRRRRLYTFPNERARLGQRELRSFILQSQSPHQVPVPVRLVTEPSPPYMKPISVRWVCHERTQLSLILPQTITALR